MLGTNSYHVRWPVVGQLRPKYEKCERAFVKLFKLATTPFCWNTNRTTKTDSQGEARFRGKYQAIGRAGRRSQEFKIELAKESVGPHKLKLKQEGAGDSQATGANPL